MTEQEEYIKECDCEKIQKHFASYSCRNNGWCKMHKCLIEEGPDGGSDCPEYLKVFWEIDAHDETWHKKNDCDYGCPRTHWVYFPRSGALIELLGDKFDFLGHNKELNHWACTISNPHFLTYQGQSPRLALVRAVKKI